MIKNELEKIYKQKINLLKKYNKAYFDKNAPIVHDKDYDELKKEILLLEKENNFLKSKDSPSNIVGYKPSKNFKKIPHRIHIQLCATQNIAKFADVQKTSHSV